MKLRSKREETFTVCKPLPLIASTDQRHEETFTKEERKKKNITGEAGNRHTGVWRRPQGTSVWMKMGDKGSPEELACAAIQGG